jgi:hypothetical protein
MSTSERHCCYYIDCRRKLSVSKLVLERVGFYSCFKCAGLCDKGSCSDPTNCKCPEYDKREAYRNNKKKELLSHITEFDNPKAKDVAIVLYRMLYHSLHYSQVIQYFSPQECDLAKEFCINLLTEKGFQPINFSWSVPFVDKCCEYLYQDTNIKRTQKLILNYVVGSIGEPSLLCFLPLLLLL